MEFTHFGAGTVLVSMRQVQILIDRPDDKYGLKLPKIKPDVELSTTVGEEGFKHNDSFNITNPGEYEIKTVEIQGIAARLHVDDPKDLAKGIVYTIGSADLRLLVTGNIAPTLSDDQIEAIGDINVMIVPVGGHGLTLDASGAAKLVSQLEPQYVIPVHYDDGKTKYAMPQDKLEPFLKEVGGEGIKPVDKFKISAKDLPEEETSVVVLKPHF